MPSTEEAFGVAYIEAMAAGVPAIGCRGEPGPEEIAAAGRRLRAGAARGHRAPEPAHRRAALRPPAPARGRPQRARATVAANFTWERCGEQTLAAYRDALRVKPVLFVTGHVPAYRVGALARLHEREGIELALFGGRSHARRPRLRRRAAASPPHARVPRELARLAPQRGLPGGRLPDRRAPRAAGGWAGARRGGVPLILWASLWAHPRSAAHALSYLPLRRLYRLGRRGRHLRPPRERLRRGARRAQRARGAAVGRQRLLARTGRRAAPTSARAGRGAMRFLFVGRQCPEKGLEVLLRGMARERPAGARGAELVGVGSGQPSAPRSARASVHLLGALDPRAAARGLRGLRRAGGALDADAHLPRAVGLVVNEAMNRGLAVIASDAVGAAAGGLVRDGDNGIVVPAGDAAARSPRRSSAWRATGRCAAAGRGRRAGRARLQPRRLGGGLLWRTAAARALRSALVALIVSS